MALTDEQRGPRAAWLYRHRVSRFGSGQGGLAALGEELRARGAYRAPDTIKGWEASDARSPIPVDVVPHLVEIFNDPYPTPVRPASTADLVAALAAQTGVIGDLVAQVKALVAQNAELIAARLAPDRADVERVLSVVAAEERAQAQEQAQTPRPPRSPDPRTDEGSPRRSPADVTE